MKHQASSAEPAPSGRGVYTVQSADDFIAIPQKRLIYRGLNLSRSSVIRLINSGEIKVTKLRVTGGIKGRTFILKESLDAWLERELAHFDQTSSGNR